jgi:hypothetical protein
MAHLRHADRLWQCPLFGVDRKTFAQTEFLLTLQDCDLRMKIFLNPIFIFFWNALPFFKVSERPRGHSQMAFNPY